MPLVTVLFALEAELNATQMARKGPEGPLNAFKGGFRVRWKGASKLTKKRLGQHLLNGRMFWRFLAFWRRRIPNVRLPLKVEWQLWFWPFFAHSHILLSPLHDKSRNVTKNREFGSKCNNFKWRITPKIAPFHQMIDYFCIRKKGAVRVVGVGGVNGVVEDDWTRLRVIT